MGSFSVIMEAGKILIWVTMSGANPTLCRSGYAAERHVVLYLIVCLYLCAYRMDKSVNLSVNSSMKLFILFNFHGWFN